MLAHAAVSRSNRRAAQDHSAQSFARAGQNTRYMAIELTDEGDSFCTRGNPQEALDCFLKAMRLLKSGQFADNGEIAACHYKIACAYTMLDMHNEAQKHYRQYRQTRPASMHTVNTDELAVKDDMQPAAFHKDTVAHRFFKLLREF